MHTHVITWLRIKGGSRIGVGVSTEGNSMRKGKEQMGRDYGRGKEASGALSRGEGTWPDWHHAKPPLWPSHIKQPGSSAHHS